MDVQELRTLSVEELKTRTKQWKDDLFRARFKAFSNETKDTSVFKKLRKDIARAYTVLTEKASGVVVETKAAQPIKQAAPVEDKAATKPKAKKAAAPKASKTSTKKGKE